MNDPPSFDYDENELETSENYNISVLFNGIICDISIDKHDSIGVLKEKVLQINDIYESSSFQYFSVFLVRWSTSILSVGALKRLTDCGNAYESIRCEENSWPGYISILVAPIISLPANISSQVADILSLRQNNQSHESEYNPWINDPMSCMEWIICPSRYVQCDYSVGSSYGSNNNGNISDRIFDLLSNTCLKQGILSRKVNMTASHMEQWKEQYFMLSPTNMWYFNLMPSNKTIENERRIFSLPLDHSTSVNFYQGSPDKIFLENESFELPLVLRSNMNEETSEYSWIEAINNRSLYKEALFDENSSIISAETIIADYEMQLSSYEMRSLCNLDNLHGILSNQRLRGAVKGVLFKEDRDEFLRFWEMAEDYRMNHEEKDEEMRRSRCRMIADSYLSAHSTLPSLLPAIQALDSQDIDSLDYTNAEVFASYQQIVASEIIKLCEALFCHPQASSFAGKRYMQLALLPLGQSFSATAAFSVTEDSKAPESLTHPKKRSIESMSTTSSTAINNKQYNNPIMKGFFNFMTNSRQSKAEAKLATTPSSDATTSSIISGRKRPSRRSSDVGCEEEFNDWLRHTSNGTLATDKIASKAPESWWMDLKDYLKDDPERYEIFTLRKPASWLPYDCRSIIDEICSKGLPFQFLQSEDLLSTLGFGKILRFGYVDCRFLPHSATNPTANGHSNGSLTPTTHSPHSSILGSNNTPLTARARVSTEIGSPSTIPVRPRSIGSSTEQLSALGLSSVYYDMTAVSTARDALQAASMTPDQIPLFADWKKLFIILAEWQGNGRLYLFDPITWILYGRIHCQHISKLTINAKDASIIDLVDKKDNNWFLRPEIVADRDLNDRDCGKMGMKIWLTSIASYCRGAITVENIVYKGQLSKRGKVNTAFKRRWFILLVDNHRHYKVST
jgi:hypothetical protein